MLFKATVSPSTLKIIRQIFSIDDLADFELVGGTALALQIGHRISVDIDLFSKNKFEPIQLKECLQDHFSDHQLSFDYAAKNTLIGSIDQIKFDFIRHAYTTIKQTKIIEGLRLCSLEDIAAMKINAITDNGTRIKDFVDLYYLLQYFKLEQLMQFYQLKYPSGNILFALKSITWFNDLDPDGIKNINFVKGHDVPFKKLKSFLTDATEDYLNSHIF